MRNLSLIFLFLFLITSCKDKNEEICRAPAIEHNLKGGWTATGTLFGAPIGPSQVVFTEAGDVLGSAEFLGEVGDAERVDWAISGGKVNILIDYGSNNTMDFVLPVIENQCRIIRLGENDVLYIELSRGSAFE